MATMSVTKLSMPLAMVAAVLLAAWQIPNYFMLRVVASQEHAVLAEAHVDIAKSVQRVRMQGDIQAANSKLAYMDTLAMTPAQVRDYDLLKFSVQDMAQRLRDAQ